MQNELMHFTFSRATLLPPTHNSIIDLGLGESLMELRNFPHPVKIAEEEGSGGGERVGVGLSYKGTHMCIKECVRVCMFV